MVHGVSFPLRAMSMEPPPAVGSALHGPTHFPCSECEASFNAERNLVLHRAWAHPIDSTAETAESVFRCPICPRTFLRPASFKGHLSLHSESENVVCPQCDDEFQSRTELARHQSTQHGQVEEPEMVALQKLFKTCTQCQQIFASAQQLRIHREKHVKIREMTKSKFKRPTPGRKSRVDKPHLCSFCPSSFSKKSYRIRHERTHTGEKPFQCQFCDKRFNQNETRKIHELKHSGKRPHACQLCPMSFTQRGNLKTHVYRVHSITLKSNDYLQCQQCSCAFKKLSSLNTHITRRHPKCLLSETPDETESREEGAENVNQGQESVMKVALPLKGKSEGHFIMHIPVLNEKDCMNPVPSVGSMDQNVGTPFSKSVASPCVFNESIESPVTPGLTSQLSQPSTPAMPTLLEMPVNESKANHNEIPMDLPKNAILEAEAEAQAGTIILDPNVLGMDIESFMIEDRDKRSPTPQLKTPPRPTFNETSSNVFKELDLCHQNNRPKEEWDDGSTLDLVKPTSLTTSQGPDTKELDKWKPIGEDRTLNGSKTAKSKHQCQYCDKQFIKNSDLLRHIRVHTGERPFACDQCHKKFSLKSTLISHKRLHSDQRTKLTCDQCGDKFLSKTSLRSHIRLHSSEAPYQCRSCSQRFQTPVQRRAHAISVHEKPRKDVPKSKDTPNENDPSLKISVPASSLIEALNSVTNVGVPLLGSVVRLQLDGVHMESAIAQLEVDEALLSQLKFGGNIDIVINGDQVISTPVEPPPLEEMIVPDVIESNAPPPEPNQMEEQDPPTHSDFGREPELSPQSKRLPTVSNDASGLSCQFCSKTFKKPSQTKRHERIHTGERPFECQECSKRFNQSNALKMHMKKHSGERPFICPFCSFAFTQKCNLKTHICRAHSVQAQQLIEYANWDV
ncbi:hypothetical protein TCAL_04198 [Tigriopus californicus]|uniref:C2H2-type domain-containing protein n=1 Tax=Tigriopus californicus TaxID=6832 RepID=A0A553N7E6_TIGCA|nr:zinc finger protein 236-like [Tigriopus californicus]TRY61365.1 hypothetical protein TCAL_04198 [Tigriopus californicus]|eukprot:TCALIF_04198-PA protein Name:"Similar to ZNF236 Zinc finger protein 236 (Homo sapiens)" AED:0.02 eAED:0.02 QI:65/1/1/1/1/1/7/21/904